MDKEASYKYDFLNLDEEKHGIDLQLYGVEAHKPIGAGERCHIYLRIRLNIARTRYRLMVSEIIIRYIVKALDDTMGPDRLVTSMMVFETVPNLKSSERNHRDQYKRMEVILTTRDEMELITAELGIRAALKPKLPPATNNISAQGNQSAITARRVRNGKKR